MEISSVHNPKVKYLAKLLHKKHRDKEKKFLIEGYYPILMALKHRYPIEELLFSREAFRSKFDNHTLLENVRKAGIKASEVTREIIEKLTSGKNPEGLIAVAPQIHNTLKDHKPTTGGLYVITESIEKPGNLGAVCRLADNAGVDSLIVCDMRADVFSTEVQRSSIGTIFSIPVLESSTQDAVQWCKDNRIQTLASSPTADTIYTETDMTKGTAIVLGAEYSGLSDTWMNQADQSIKIPMFGEADSLDVVASSAILLYEAVRQRNPKSD